MSATPLQAALILFISLAVNARALQAASTSKGLEQHNAIRAPCSTPTITRGCFKATSPITLAIPARICLRNNFLLAAVSL